MADNELTPTTRPNFIVDADEDPVAKAARILGGRSGRIAIAGRALRHLDIAPAGVPLSLVGHSATMSVLRDDDTETAVGLLTAIAPFDNTTVPKTLDDLKVIEVLTYDLSVSEAASLNIPIIGEVSGGFARRVVTQEYRHYAEVPGLNGETILYGYAIRICVTSSTTNIKAKTSLAFLAAEAQLQTTEARFAFQVVGLAGQKVEDNVLPPQEFNVENYFKALESVRALLVVRRDTTTRFTPHILATRFPGDINERVLLTSTARAYALTQMLNGRRLEQALDGSPSAKDIFKGAITDTYLRVTGSADPSSTANDEGRKVAKRMLAGLRVSAG